VVQSEDQRAPGKLSSVTTSKEASSTPYSSECRCEVLVGLRQRAEHPWGGDLLAERPLV